jgi:hypothetical protein
MAAFQDMRCEWLVKKGDIALLDQVAEDTILDQDQCQIQVCHEMERYPLEIFQQV